MVSILVCYLAALKVALFEKNMFKIKYIREDFLDKIIHQLLAEWWIGATYKILNKERSSSRVLTLFSKKFFINEHRPPARPTSLDLRDCMIKLQCQKKAWGAKIVISWLT